MQAECVQCASSEMLDWKMILAIISAVSALTATIIGPIVAYKIAVRQIHVSTDATERKEWLNSFRDDLAHFITKAIRVRLYLEGRHNLKEMAALTESDLEHFNVLFQKLVLRLDPIVPTHLENLNLLHQVHANTSDTSTSTYVEFSNLIRRLTDQSRQLIHVELDDIRGIESERIITNYKPK